MRKTLLIVPEWIDPTWRNDPLSEHVGPMLGHSKPYVARLSRLENGSAPELSYFGIDPRQFDVAQGPLAVAALGFDPPARSAQYQATLLSFDGQAVENCRPSGLDERIAIWTQLERLNSKRTRVLPSQELDGGFVVENGSPFGLIVEPTELTGRTLAGHWPESEDESILRRLIDDSINLLTEFEPNQRRIDEGLPPINLLWPWGPGFRPTLPRLELVHGPCRLFSNSMRVEGIARLVGWRHIDRITAGSGTNFRLDDAKLVARESGRSIIVVDAIQSFRNNAQNEEVDWMTRQIIEQLIQPLVEDSNDGQASLLVLSTSSTSGGLAAMFGPFLDGFEPLPFDSRSIDEKRLEPRDVNELVHTYFLWNAAP